MRRALRDPAWRPPRAGPPATSRGDSPLVPSPAAVVGICVTSMTHLCGRSGCAQRRAGGPRRGGGGGASFISSIGVQPHSQGWTNGARLSCVSSTWRAGVPSGVRTITESLRRCIIDSIPTAVDRCGIPSTISGLPSLVMMSSPVCGSFFCWPSAGRAGSCAIP